MPASNDTPNSVKDKLQERVNSLVEWLFEQHRTVVPRESKVINDALLGNQYFSKHEILVIDCPLLQRLKRIRQTGLVYHVFPSANHSRFEHSLGVVTLAERCFRAILERSSIEFPLKAIADTDRLSGDLAHLRMAALLHDIGHGLCSHASEQIYEFLTDMRVFKGTPEYAKNSPGEILSYLIVKSPTFTSWFGENVIGKCHAQLNLDMVAEMILGKHPDPDKHFLAQIISSPYDADKLDYIARDSYNCGLALTVDLPRFYSMISTAEKDSKRVLVLRNYVPLEQILFSKMILVGSVYHHQKVKCLDSMLRSLIKHTSHHAEQCSFQIRGKTVSFADCVEYLYVTDDEFFNQLDSLGDGFVSKMIDRFRQRDFFVRCVEISRRTVKKENWYEYGRKRLINLSDLPRDIDKIEYLIHDNLPVETKKKSDLGEILLSVPSIPKFKTGFAYIQGSPTAELERVDDYFPVEQWTDAYAHNKWKSFVYGPRAFAKEIRDSAIGILRDELSLDIDIKRSNQACHLSD